MTPVPPRSHPNRPGGSPQRFGGLFDANFSNFITPTIVKIVYTLALIAAVGISILSIFMGIFGELFAGNLGSAFANIVMVPIAAILFLLLLRLLLEVTMVVFDIADNLKAIRASGRPPGQPHLPPPH